MTSYNSIYFSFCPPPNAFVFLYDLLPHPTDHLNQKNVKDVFHIYKRNHNFQISGIVSYNSMYILVCSPKMSFYDLLGICMSIN